MIRYTGITVWCYMYDTKDDVHDMLQCQTLHQSGVLYNLLFLQCTVCVY